MLAAAVGQLIAVLVVVGMSPLLRGVIENLKEMWGDLKSAVRNAREMLFTDGQTVSETLSRSWSNWVHNGLGVPKRA